MQCGPFTLVEFIAEGGGGAVWRAVHERTGRPVAIKVVPCAPGPLPTEVRLELEALSSMIHPNIIWVYDYGRVAGHLTTPRGVEIRPGAIWIAMELAGGTTADVNARTWTRFRELALQALDALAYAHARGVLHRDVKPGNLLIGTDGRLKLSDFGIAIVDGRTQFSSAGTAAYMAPEQQLGDVINTGPASDIYALGVTIWRLLCGTRPFEGTGKALAIAKLREGFTPFEPRIAVPDGLESWLRTCMRPHPEDRFAFAADAHHALAGLQLTVRNRSSTAPTFSPDAPTRVSTVQTEIPSDLARHHRPPRAPMTTEWQSEEIAVSRLLNVGLELFEMRACRTVGRMAERGRLWEALQEVHRIGEPRVVLVRGSSGLGRKHLAQWLGERADESGAARQLRLSFRTGGPREALRSLLTRDPDPDVIDEALEAFARRWGALEPHHIGRIRALLVDGEATPELPFTVAEIAARLASERPLVMVLQDVHRGGEAYLRAMLQQSRPILVVATAPERAEVAELGHTLTLKPLNEDEGITFCRQLLGLDPEVAHRLSKLARGNPGFALQVCEHWARQGALVPGPRGYQLAADVPIGLPDSDTWTARIRDFFKQNRTLEQDVVAVALVGRDVPAEVLDVALGSVERSDGVTSALCVEGFLRPVDGGWTWASAGLPEYVLESASVRPKTALAVANVLGASREAAAQRARCLLHAQQSVAALDSMHTAIVAAAEHYQHHEVLELFPEMVAIARLSGVPLQDSRLEDAWVARVRASQGRLDAPELTDLLTEALDVSIAHGFERLTAWCLLLEVRWLRSGRERREPIQRLMHMLSLRPDPNLLAETLSEASQLALQDGDSSSAVDYATRAVRFARKADLPNVAEFEGRVAQALTTARQFVAAMERAVAAEAEASGGKDPFAEMLAVHVQWEILFEQRQYAAGVAQLERAKRMARRLANGHEWFFHVLIGYAYRLLQDPRARRHFVECLENPSGYGHMYAHAGLLSLAETPQVWDEHWGEFTTRCLDRGLADVHFARILIEAGDHAIERGMRTRGASAYAAARDQLEKLGRDASSVDSILEILGR